jgi:hypothetical protein
MKMKNQLTLLIFLGIFLLNNKVQCGLFDFLKSDEDDDHSDDSEWEKIFNDGEKECGYLGGSATKVETKLDDCFDKYVVESRVRMSIGFELCFGFNFGRLNNTVSKPLNYMQRIVNTKVLDLSLEICQAHKDIDRRPKLDNGAVDTDKEQTFIGHCKLYFDRIIDAIYNENYSVEDVFTQHKENMQDLYKEQEILKIEKEIRDLVGPVDECKLPEQTLKDNLIIKYTKKFLQKIVNPELPSFNYENLDVLLHPEKYMLKNEKADFPDFEEMVEKEKEEELHEAEEEGDVLKQLEIKDPTKRFVIMKDKIDKEKEKKNVIMKNRSFYDVPEVVKEEILRSDFLIARIEKVLKNNKQLSPQEKAILESKVDEELGKWWNKHADDLYAKGLIDKEEMHKTVYRPSTHKHVKGKFILTKDAPEDQYEPYHKEPLTHEGSTSTPQ